MHHWAPGGIVGRAVLVDLARWRQAEGSPIQPGRSDVIEPEEVELCLRSQQVDVDTGDILLLRTGWVSWYRTLDARARARYAEKGHPACGLRPGEETLRLLWDLHPAAVAADNPALEVWPPGCWLAPDAFEDFQANPSKMPEVFLHFSVIPLLGLAIGELFDLDALAEYCAREGSYEASFVAAPMHMIGGVASPGNALAIV